MASEPACVGQVQTRAGPAFTDVERFARATLDGLSAHIAIVDAEGTITAVNRAWRQFAAANLPPQQVGSDGPGSDGPGSDGPGSDGPGSDGPGSGCQCGLCEGANYMAVCRAAAAAGCSEAQQWLDGMGAVLAGETDLAEFEYACHGPDEQRWFVARISLIPGDAPPRLVVAHESITQRKLSELAVSESEARYRSIFENNRSVMLLIERDTGAIFDANRAAATYYGWTHEQLCRMTIGDIATTPLAEILADMNRPYEEQPNHYTFAHRRADGSVRDVELYHGPVQVGGRELVCSIVHDSTERRQAEQALVRSEAALKHSQQVAHVGYWTWDIPSNTVTGSEEAWHIYGLDPAIGVLDYDTVSRQVIHPDDREWVQAKALQLLAERRMFDEEYRVVWPDGSVHYVHVMADETILDEHGNFAQLSNVVQDITERKLAELEQVRLMQQLQRQERLAAIGQLAAGIAHDFNNLMSVISIYGELLSAAPGLSEKDRARAQTIMDQAERATRMIRQILDFSRQSVFARQQLNLLPLLKEVVKLLRQTLPEDIAITLAALPGEYFALADPTRIQQLVMNLAVNARDAMPQGGQLRFELAHLQLGPDDKLPLPGMDQGDWLRLAVSDTGSGIAPAHLDHIFEPFFTTKAPGKGTGLGLAQVHGIVALHDGQIGVQSELGGGTTFTVYLPAVVVEVAGTAAAIPALALLPQGNGQCILVVEDQTAVRAAVVALLEALHYRVLQAVDGAAALHYLGKRRGQVDLIVSDVVMPRLGGIDLVKLLREQGVRTPVILMSGHASDEERAGLAEAGIAAWLDKPPSTWLLAKTVAEALAGV